MMKNKWLLLLLLWLPILSGCNETDDVQKIFTGKTWKFTYITVKDGYKPFDFWGGDAAAQKKSMEYVSAAGNYQLTFEGATTDDDISGNVNGKVVASTLTGSWTANGKDQKFRAAVKTNIQEPDILAKKFVEGLNKAESYKGDEKNLYIYYQSGQQTLCLVFHAL